MDGLDRIILNSQNKVIITSISKFAGNECGNSITVEFAVPQDHLLLQREPLSRLQLWMIGDGLYSNLDYRRIRIDKIPDSIDPDDVSIWLAEEFAQAGKRVQVRLWKAPMKFSKVEFQPTNEK